MDDITAFIAARLDEVERAARAATPGPWNATHVTYGGDWKPDYSEVISRSAVVVEHVYHEGGGVGLADAAHIAYHDPAAVLRDVEATRRLLELHHEGPHYECDLCREYDGGWPCKTVQIIASRWSDHPAYRPEWAVED